MRQPLTPDTQSAPGTLPLPERPNLDQLRHRARDLLNAARAGEPDAARRLSAVGKGETLAAAQLAVAREHGFPSWERLKEAVEERRSRSDEAPDPQDAAASTARGPAYVIRMVASLEELGVVCDVIGAQIDPPMRREDRRFQELWPRFEADRSLMWLAEDGAGEVVGGALAFRPGGSGVTMRAIGLTPGARRQGVGRRLMAAIEMEAMKVGARGINLGADEGAVGFYRRLGYAGRGAMMHKGLPLPGPFLAARLRKLQESQSAG